jgi:hypothetical protein
VTPREQRHAEHLAVSTGARLSAAQRAVARFGREHVWYWPTVFLLVIAQCVMIAVYLYSYRLRGETTVTLAALVASVGASLASLAFWKEWKLKTTVREEQRKDIPRSGVPAGPARCQENEMCFGMRNAPGRGRSRVDAVPPRNQ